MERKAPRKSPRLAAKLKNAVQQIQVDVFGYEPKVTQNIILYFDRLSKETGIPKDRLLLRIFKDLDSIHVGIHHQGRLVKKIPVPALIGLFTDTTPSGYLDLETRVNYKIKAFLEGLATTEGVCLEEVHICMACTPERVGVRAYKGIDYIKDIPLRTIIKHFIG